ncbi:site-specific integrase [Chloroflexota bacterium]
MDALAQRLQPEKDYLALFLQSRAAIGVRPKTLRYYRDRLTKFVSVVSYTKARRLETATGLPCNPHTFRRTFACLLRKAGVDTMTIKDLGRWESLEMVQRYTRSVSFQDSLKFYRAPLS